MEIQYRLCCVNLMWYIRVNKNFDTHEEKLLEDIFVDSLNCSAKPLLEGWYGSSCMNYYIII